MKIIAPPRYRSVRTHLTVEAIYEDEDDFTDCILDEFWDYDNFRKHKAITRESWQLASPKFHEGRINAFIAYVSVFLCMRKDELIENMTNSPFVI